jgi:hypothetical protein
MSTFKTSIEQLLLNHPEPTVQDFKTCVWSFFNLDRDQPIVYPNTVFEAPKLFRIRPFTASDEANHFNYYTHPTKENTIMGRTNLPSHPVFYGTFHPKTGLKESIKHHAVSTRFFVSKWRVKKSLNFSPIIPTAFLKDAAGIFNPFDDELKEKLISFSTFIGDQISLDNEDYTIASFLSHLLLYENNLDAISYPSRADGSGINFSIHPRIGENDNLVLRRIWDVSFDSENNSISLNRIGLCRNNSSIEWHSHNLILKYHELMSEFREDFR